MGVSLFPCFPVSPYTAVLQVWCWGCMMCKEAARPSARIAVLASHVGDLKRTVQAAWVITQVASQINTFLLAGYETTASALAFTVYHVAANPDKEAKLLAEIDAFGRSRAPTLEDLDQVGNRNMAAAALRTGSPAMQSASRVRANQQPADAVFHASCGLCAAAIPGCSVQRGAAREPPRSIR